MQQHPNQPLDSAGRQVYLLKPALLMNINGQSVARAAQTLGVAASTDIVVAHDDLDRGFGRLSPKAGGSPGGHNGVRSCIAKLGTDRFRRLRIGQLPAPTPAPTTQAPALTQK